MGDKRWIQLFERKREKRLIRRRATHRPKHFFFARFLCECERAPATTLAHYLWWWIPFGKSFPALRSIHFFFCRAQPEKKKIIYYLLVVFRVVIVSSIQYDIEWQTNHLLNPMAVPTKKGASTFWAIIIIFRVPVWSFFLFIHPHFLVYLLFSSVQFQCHLGYVICLSNRWIEQRHRTTQKIDEQLFALWIKLWRFFHSLSFTRWLRACRTSQTTKCR